MPSKGEVVALAFDVSFNGGGTLSRKAPQLEEIFSGNGSADDFPAEGIIPYYDRASYGDLSLRAECYSYDAINPIDYYAYDQEKLVSEILDALEAEAGGASRFDADGDGRVDVVYLWPDMAETPQPDSPWWAHTSYGRLDKRVGSYIVLHRRPGQVGSVISAIHESGHALGLPDLYDDGVWMDSSYDGEPAGSGSFDMMDTNAGDIDGYLKYALGWISDDEVSMFAIDDGLSISCRLGKMEENTLPKGTSRLVMFGAGGKALLAAEFVSQEGNFQFDESIAEIPDGIRIWRLDDGPHLLKLADLDGGKQHRVDKGIPHPADGSFGCHLLDGQEEELEVDGKVLVLSCSIEGDIAQLDVSSRS